MNNNRIQTFCRIIVPALLLLNGCSKKHPTSPGANSSNFQPATLETQRVVENGPTPEEKARKRQLALETETLRIKREGLNVEYRLAKARFEDATQALQEGSSSGDEHQANENAAEAARLEAIDAWLANMQGLTELECQHETIRARSEGRDVDVRTAEARLEAAKEDVADGERAQQEKQRGGPLTLPEPTLPSFPDTSPAVGPAAEVAAAYTPIPPPETLQPQNDQAKTPPALEPVPLATQIKESQERAMKTYPALAVLGSPLNTKFIEAFRQLQTQKSPRLQDPSWPEQLAGECASSSSVANR